MPNPLPASSATARTAIGCAGPAITSARTARETPFLPLFLLLVQAATGAGGLNFRPEVPIPVCNS